MNSRSRHGVFDNFRDRREQRRGKRGDGPVVRVEDTPYPNRKPKSPASRPAPAPKKRDDRAGPPPRSRGRAEPTAPAKERPKISGPDDLRRIFDEKTKGGGIKGGGTGRGRSGKKRR